MFNQNKKLNPLGEKQTTVSIGTSEWPLFWNTNVHCISTIVELSMLVKFITVFLYVFVSLHGSILAIDPYTSDTRREFSGNGHVTVWGQVNTKEFSLQDITPPPHSWSCCMIHVNWFNKSLFKIISQTDFRILTRLIKKGYTCNKHIYYYLLNIFN